MCDDVSSCVVLLEEGQEIIYTVDIYIYGYIYMYIWIHIYVYISSTNIYVCVCEYNTYLSVPFLSFQVWNLE